MRILVDCRVLTRGTRSGIPIYAEETISRLIKSPHHTFTLLTTGVKQNQLPAEWLSHANVSHVTTHIPNKALDIAMRVTGHPQWDIKTKTDVAFTPHFNQLPLAHAPRILTCHDISFYHFPQYYAPKERFWHWLQNWKKQLVTAKQIIAVSEYTRQDIIRTLGIPAEKVHRIYPGISTSFKNLTENDPLLRDFLFKYNLERPYILSFGGFASRKNLEVLVRAFEKLIRNPQFADFELVLAGNIGNINHALQRLITHRATSRRIRSIANIPDNERVFLYNGAKLFVFPSFFEGFGFPPLEAQACGVPVIASNRTSLPEILGKGALYINPWSIDETAQCMEEVLSSPRLQQQLRMQGSTNSAHFSWDVSVKDTLSLIEKTI